VPCQKFKIADGDGPFDDLNSPRSFGPQAAIRCHANERARMRSQGQLSWIEHSTTAPTIRLCGLRHFTCYRVLKPCEPPLSVISTPALSTTPVDGLRMRGIVDQQRVF
jgi:hypothetical protein